jgi:hypothetical protein
MNTLTTPEEIVKFCYLPMWVIFQFVVFVGGGAAIVRRHWLGVLIGNAILAVGAYFLYFRLGSVGLEFVLSLQVIGLLLCQPALQAATRESRLLRPKGRDDERSS